MSDFKELTEAIKKFRAERDWDQFQNPKESAIGLAIEACEVLEHFQWKTGKDLEEYITKHKGDIADELADVLYGVLALADQLGIDMKEAFYAKLAKTAKKYPVEKFKGSPKKYNEL